MPTVSGRGEDDGLPDLHPLRIEVGIGGKQGFQLHAVLLGNRGGDVALLDGMCASGGRGGLGGLRRGGGSGKRCGRDRRTDGRGRRRGGFGRRGGLDGRGVGGNRRRRSTAGGGLRGEHLRVPTELIVFQAEPLDLGLEFVQFFLSRGRVGRDEENFGQLHFAIAHPLPNDFGTVGGRAEPEETLEVVNGGRGVVEVLLKEEAQLEVRGSGAWAGFQGMLECLRRAPVIELLAQLLTPQEIRLALLILRAVPRGDATRRAEHQQEQAGEKAWARRKIHGAQRSGKISAGAITRCPQAAKSGFETDWNCLEQPARGPRSSPQQARV